MKKLLLLSVALLATLTSFAQIDGKVSGNLLDEKNQALSFANVLLLKTQDSTLVKGGLADEKGYFEITNITSGSYFLKASMVGYQTLSTPKFVISEDTKTIKLADLKLHLATKALNEVTVSAKKPLIEQKADKIILNVENSIVSSGNTALEVLQKAPGVTVDQNDVISLKGKQGVVIYMDGKPTYMSQADLANLLKNMNSDQIEKIEIITNPSAKYDAAGNSGIINIVTKKNKSEGTNGSVNLGVGRSIPYAMVYDYVNGQELIKTPSNRMKYNGSINLNNRKGKFNTFLNLGLSDRQGFNGNHFTRVLDQTIYEQYAYRLNKSENFSYKLGTDYYLSKKTTIGVLVNGNIGNWGADEPITNIAYIKTSENVIISSPKTTSDPINRWKSGIFNANFKHTFDSTGRELTADIDYSIYDNLSREKGMFTHFYDANNVEYGTPLKITSNIPNKYNITATKIDYSHPFKNGSKLEMGIKNSFVKSDNDIKFYKNDAIDIGRSNHFVYTENINAAYTNYNFNIGKKLNVQTGLRLENTNSKGKSLTLDEERTRKYTQLFPSIFLMQTVNKNNQLSYSYSRRIDRPDYESLNPFIFFLDPYTYELGNAYLKPQFTNAYSVSHTYKGAFTTNLSYSRTNDFIAQVIKNAKDEPEILAQIIKNNTSIEIDPQKITFAFKENISQFDNYGLAFSFPVPIKKWWNAQNNFTLSYNQFKGTISGQNLNAGKMMYNIYTAHTLTINKTLSSEISMWYNSPQVYGMMLGSKQYAVNAGFKKTLWKNTATLKVNINDIFLTSFWGGQANFGGVNLNIKNRWDSRSLMFSFNYRFGNQNVKAARRRETATESEQNRVKSGGN